MVPGVDLKPPPPSPGQVAVSHTSHTALGDTALGWEAADVAVGRPDGEDSDRPRAQAEGVATELRLGLHTQHQGGHPFRVCCCINTIRAQHKTGCNVKKNPNQPAEAEDPYSS